MIIKKIKRMKKCREKSYKPRTTGQDEKTLRKMAKNLSSSACENRAEMAEKELVQRARLRHAKQRVQSKKALRQIKSANA